LLNPTLLLLGTFSFELWFESYLGFIEESLHFWEIANRPSSSTSSPQLLCFFSAPPPPPSLAMCHAPAASAPPFLAPRAAQRPRRRFPGPRWLSPRLSTSRRCRSSRHACRRHRQLLLARAVPLPALKHAQRLLCDLLYSPEHLYSTAFPLPERSSSPDLRRTLWPPSTANHAASHPQSSTPRAPPRLPAAH
jgi:hypothetical protein